MACEFCGKNVKTKCKSVFQALECQKYKAEDARRDLERLEIAALRFYDSATEIISTVDAYPVGIGTNYNIYKVNLADELGSDVSDEERELAECLLKLSSKQIP